MRAFTLTLCLLAATACDENSPLAPSVALNERFTLAAGGTALLADTGIRLQFVSVTSDSRCPADAICVHAGDAVIEIRLLDGAQRPGYQLHTGDAQRNTVVHGRLHIRLADLQPYPFSHRQIGQADYRAAFVATMP